MALSRPKVTFVAIKTFKGKKEAKDVKNETEKRRNREKEKQRKRETEKQRERETKEHRNRET